MLKHSPSERKINASADLSLMIPDNDELIATGLFNLRCLDQRTQEERSKTGVFA